MLRRLPPILPFTLARAPHLTAILAAKNRRTVPAIRLFRVTLDVFAT